VIVVKRRVRVPPERVFQVLADGWLFSGWVVGASHIRRVDPDWPQVGQCIHHSIGAWPAQLKDTTTVTAVENNTMLELQARMRPIAVARIRLTLTPLTQNDTEISMAEEFVAGPLSMLPAPAQALMLLPRNSESLSRLAAMAVGVPASRNASNDK
jgi:uncharacterized protein YndB with AHSA1/START domain